MSPGNNLPSERFAGLVEQAAAVAGQTDLTAVLVKTVEAAMELTGAPYGALGVIGEDGELIEFLHAGLDPEAAAAIGSPPRGRGVLGTITKSKQTVRISHISEHPDSVGFPEHHPAMDSFLGVPIHVGDEVYGNLYLTNKEGGFTEEDEALVSALAVIAGSALTTARLQRRLRRLAVIEDRERIARDLHDAIIQDLFAVGLSLQTHSTRIADPEVQKSIEHTVERLDEAIASLRRFIFDLRPPVWADRDIRQEINDLLAQLAAPYPAGVRVTFEGALDDLPPSLIDDTLHIVREAASNALRHAEAERIDVMIRRDRDELVVTVSDQGRGFDPEVSTRGMGLENLRTRAARAGGDAAIISAPGAGTTVRISLPLT